MQYGYRWVHEVLQVLRQHVQTSPEQGEEALLFDLVIVHVAVRRHLELVTESDSCACYGCLRTPAVSCLGFYETKKMRTLVRK